MALGRRDTFCSLLRRHDNNKNKYVCVVDNDNGGDDDDVEQIQLIVF